MIPSVFFQTRPANCQVACHSRSLNILFAESNRTLRRLLSFVLRSDGHQVTEKEDGRRLLETVASWVKGCEPHPLDLIMAAQDMPDVPGICSLTALRAQGRKTPFVLMTDDLRVQADARTLDAVILSGRLSVASIRQAVLEAEITEKWGLRAVG
jgi:CheY-like chemotaxis protein